MLNIRKIFMSLVMCLMFAGVIFPVSVSATDHWVWSNDSISLYVDDNTIDWYSNGKNCDVEVFTVNDYNGKLERTYHYKFFLYEGVWCYGTEYDRGQDYHYPKYDDGSRQILDLILNYR